MKLRLKILLLAVVPLLLALAFLAYAVYHHGTTLSRQEKHAVEQAWLDSKQAELRHYVKLAQSVIQPLVGAQDSAAAQREALSLLSKMEFGRDGYFFVYDLDGLSLMHPRQPELVGRDVSVMRDALGQLVLQPLLAAARRSGAQGELVRYLWHKPSAQREMQKLGYVVAVPEWNWMLGTGIYLDDIETTLADLDAAAQGNIRNMLTWVAAIAFFGTLGVALCGLALNISDHKQSDAKLRLLARQVVQSQEEERARLSRELHDGVSQWLISTKLLLEAALARLRGLPGHDDPALQKVEQPLSGALDRLHATVGEIRRISHNLRPSLLDDLGLPAALSHLAREVTDATGEPPVLHSEVVVHGQEVKLPDAHNTVLFRIAQEALTNAVRHARASTVQLALDYLPRHVQLSIRDNGRGFDYEDVQRAPEGGIGLRNMRERVAPLGGTMTLDSSPAGTRIIARLPLPA